MLDHANEKHMGPDLRGTYLVEKESNRFSTAESFSVAISLQSFVPYAERRGEKKKKRFEGVYGYTGPVNGLEALEDPAKARGLSVSLEDAKKVEEKRSEDCVGFNFEFRIRKV